MDLSVKVVLRAQAEGVSAIKKMREETAELAAAMKEVRSAASAGGSVSPGTVKALGGFAEFQKAFADAQRALAAPAKEAGLVDPEKMFRGQMRRLDQMSKVRLAESKWVASSEAADAKATSTAQKREAEGVLDFKRRMWAQQGREAEAEATTEARAAEQAAAAEIRAAQASLRANMAYWRQRSEAARRGEAEEVAAAKRQAAATRRMIWGVPGFGGDAAGHVTVTVQALPGAAVTSVRTQGRVSATAAPRGQIQVAR